jgi:hypothetical protein
MPSSWAATSPNMVSIATLSLNLAMLAAGNCVLKLRQNGKDCTAQPNCAVACRVFLILDSGIHPKLGRKSSDCGKGGLTVHALTKVLINTS